MATSVCLSDAYVWMNTRVSVLADGMKIMINNQAYEKSFGTLTMYSTKTEFCQNTFSVIHHIQVSFFEGVGLVHYTNDK